MLSSLYSCIKQKPLQAETKTNETGYSQSILTIMEKAQLPESISKKIFNSLSINSSFFTDLSSCLREDPYLRILVDKEHPLDSGYEPDDLIGLKNASYRVNRNDLTLRSAAAASLEEMARTAKEAGLTLLASSAYRSFEYQTTVYERNVREMGKTAADRESARPGHSQHQLGLVIDFGSIDDSFARTKESQWLSANASRYGWSLSYPEEYESLTGYRWESWHYRYVGKELAYFIDTWFDGIQQHALRFIHEYEKS
ncbi:MAG: M15 family metallopeptidase [Treponema sp.]|nr:M15 family metallopeptidase [Treponema sp.]